MSGLTFTGPAWTPGSSILDDGSGMAELSLIDAMRIGSKSPQEQRDPIRLGALRIGLEDGLDFAGKVADRCDSHCERQRRTYQDGGT